MCTYPNNKKRKVYSGIYFHSNFTKGGKSVYLMKNLPNKFELDSFIYLLFYVTFNSQGHIVMGSLQIQQSSAYCTINQWASASNYQLSNMKRPAQIL